MYKHYVVVGDDGDVIDGFSDAFRSPVDTDVCITPSGTEERHFQIPLKSSAGIPMYRVSKGKLSEKKKDEVDLAEFALLKEKVAKACDEKLPDLLSAGITFKGLKIKTDNQDRAIATEYLSLLQSGIINPPILWRDKDNVNHLLSLGEFKQMLGDMTAFVLGCYQQVWTSKDAARASKSIDELGAAVAPLGMTI